MFDFLTLSVVIDDRIFCVHGGRDFFSVVQSKQTTDRDILYSRLISVSTRDRPDQDY